MFITLEGVEGSGKTTAAKALIARLEAAGHEVIYTREPGGNKIAEQIREVILDIENKEMDPRTEALLYAAARRQHLVEVIEPALKQGKIVICDRFIDSSIAYQGYARNIGPEQVALINDFAIAEKRPDLTFLLDVRPAVGLERINKDATREINRLDLEALDFHQAVYEGYHALAKKHKDRFEIINGEQPVVAITNDVIKIIEERLIDGKFK